MDIINLHGGKPANFLDVGGSATAAQVTEAFRILTADPKVKGILVNIFAGVARVRGAPTRGGPSPTDAAAWQCDIIAKGIIQAFNEVGLKVPLVVRLEGTNVELGKSMFKESGVPVITADDLDDAAKKAVKAIGGKA